ncbi:MAG: Hsp20/alpha crystallin family protein [Nocardioides sp.]
MTTVARRSRSPVAEMLSWLESGVGFDARSFGLAPYVKVEDFVDDGTYVLRADMPGIDPDKDVEVSIVGDMVTIRGERREEQKDKNHHELHYGSFARSVQLPHGTKPEEVSASYVDGVLEVRIPMAVPEEPSSHKVEIKREAS